MTLLDVGLLPGIIEGEVIEITAQAEGQAAAINQQIQSNTIINVVSEERIQELPDANAAEAVGRLPGVSLIRSGGEANKVVLRGLSSSYSSITIDGVRMATTGSDERSTPSDPRSTDRLSVSSYSRNIDLSVVSQRTLAGIELYKALTPDMDADAIAGSINLVTQKAPSTRLLRADMRGSYNAMDKSYDQYDFAFKYGERFFNDKLGIQATGNLEQRIRSREEYDMDNDLRADGGTTWEVTGAEVAYANEKRKRNGFGILLDYDTPEGGWIKLNTLYSKTKRDYLTHARNYPLDDEIYYHYREREEDIATFNSFIRGENHLSGFTIDWNLSYAESKSSYPYDYDVWFNEPSTTAADGTVLSGMRPCPYDKGPLEAIIPYACNNFERSYLFCAYFRGQESEEDEKSAFLDFSREYMLGKSFSGKFKFGGKYRSKSRIRSRSEVFSPYYNFAFPLYTRLSDGTVIPKDFSGTRFEDLEVDPSGNILLTNFLDTDPGSRDLFDQYRFYPLINKDAEFEWYDLNKDGVVDAAGTGRSEYLRNIEPDATFYDLIERVSAGYIMNTFNMGQNITFITGLRVESENNDYKAKFSPTDLRGYPVPSGIIRDTSAVHQETVWLPNFHLSLRPLNFMSIRLAVYKALARPDFNQRLPNFIARKSEYFYSGNALVIGNPDLKAAQAWNYEVNTSVYSSEYGLFSVSAFYKDIKDMYHMINGVAFQGDQADYGLDSLGIGWHNPWPAEPFTLVYPINSTRPTRVWGFEAEVQTYTRFLADLIPGIPRYFNNFVFNGNISIVRSETYIPGTDLEIYPIIYPPFEAARTIYVERRQKLEDQPEFFCNLAVGYDIGGFSARLSYFYQGEYNRTFSADRRSDTIQNSLSRWDLALKYNITRNLDIFLNMNNLLNAEEGTSNINRLYGWKLANRGQIYGTTADLGLRITL
jgi:TonB-dependent receptor